MKPQLALNPWNVCDFDKFKWSGISAEHSHQLCQQLFCNFASSCFVTRKTQDSVRTTQDSLRTTEDLVKSICFCFRV